METFFIYAIVGGIGVAITSGSLGSFIVWKRMAYFGDAMSHSALLGIALGFLFHINVTLGIILVAMAFSFILAYFQRQRTFSGDTVLGILAHSALAVGLVVLSQMKSLRIDLMGYLFGDILAIGMQDIIVIYTYMAFTLCTVYILWQNILLMVIQPDLARVEGVDTEKTRLFLLLLIAVFVALSIKIVGMMLVTSMLIIPAATARKFAATPERMVIFASIVGIIAVLCGLGASLQWDTPSGPSIVVSSALLFILAHSFPPGRIRA